MSTNTSPLIAVDELAELLATAPSHGGIGGRPVRLLDVRWRLDRPDGSEEHAAGHLPGAVYVSLDDELAAHGEPTDGRHPLPSVEALQAAARRWGINDGDVVVAYDDLGGLSAARAWWLLTWAGITGVRLLDGGIQAWTETGRRLHTGPVTAPAGDVTLSVGPDGKGYLPTLTIDEAAGFDRVGTLLDARAPERYRGETEPVDPRAGHIPGAINAPTGGNLDGAGYFLSPTDLRRRFTDLGVDLDAPVAAYCGSGVTASHEVVALIVAGATPALYPGSWSQWSNLPDRPAATGEEPGASA